jgi:DNA-binding GntR family transcriptional regulator
MVEFYLIRLLLEPLALRLSLERRSPEWEREVRAAHDALRAELEADVPDLFRFEEIHRNLHETLISRWLLSLYRPLIDQSVRYRPLSIGPRGGAAGVLDEHERLVEDCLAKGNDRAVDSPYAHIRRTVDSLLPQLSSSDTEGREARQFAHAAIRAASPTS